MFPKPTHLIWRRHTTWGVGAHCRIDNSCYSPTDQTNNLNIEFQGFYCGSGVILSLTSPHQWLKYLSTVLTHVYFTWAIPFYAFTLLFQNISKENVWLFWHFIHIKHVIFLHVRIQYYTSDLPSITQSIFNRLHNELQQLKHLSYSLAWHLHTLNF